MVRYLKSLLSGLFSNDAERSKVTSVRDNHHVTSNKGTELERNANTGPLLPLHPSPRLSSISDSEYSGQKVVHCTVISEALRFTIVREIQDFHNKF